MTVGINHESTCFSFYFVLRQHTRTCFFPPKDHQRACQDHAGLGGCFAESRCMRDISEAVNGYVNKRINDRLIELLVEIFNFKSPTAVLLINSLTSGSIVHTSEW